MITLRFKIPLAIVIRRAIVFASLFLSGVALGQSGDAFTLKSIYEEALTESRCHDWLRHLTKEVGPRLSGSRGAATAIDDMKALMDTLGFDTVYLQPCTVPNWERGAPATAHAVAIGGQPGKSLNVVSLGNTLGTGSGGIVGTVVEVDGLDAVRAMSRSELAGKIVFFNRPLDATKLNTFAAYGGAADQRVYGLIEAAKQGAAGVLVRSLTTRLDDHPHTGTTASEDGVDRIPALAISTNDAEWLAAELKRREVKIKLKSYGYELPPVTSYNVIGEKRGSQFPDEIILVGGHLDSWDLGEGAHDDGTGVVHSLQVLPLLQKIGHEPKRTFRCVLFMNEENGLGGGKAYWKASDEAGEFHLAAIESDRGGFTPRGFSAQGRDDVFTSHYKRVNEWLPLLEPYGLAFSQGGSGADISGLIDQGGLLLGFLPDSQRYFDFHHTDVDVFEAVNKRELELGAAAITSLVYLIDQHGLR